MQLKAFKWSDTCLSLVAIEQFVYVYSSSKVVLPYTLSVK